MDYNFQIDQETLQIPISVYLPIKRCPFCQSVFITEASCEACGRYFLHHLIGVPFGPKSLFRIKEHYVESFNIFQSFFPILENKKSVAANSYIHKLEKRFSDLISAFNTPGIIAHDEGKLFKIESMELIDELLRYGVSPDLLKTLLLENDNSLVGSELLLHLNETDGAITADSTCLHQLLEYRVLGALRLDYLLKAFIISVTVLTLAVQYKEIISSQFCK